MGFPTRPSELTPAWLSEVLSADVADFRTETIGVGSGFAGSIYRVHLAQDSSSEAGDLPETLIWKTISTHPSTHKLLTQLGIYQSEADFYARLAGHARVAPRAHYYNYDDDSGSVCLLLEDLTGMEAGDQIEGCTPKQARMIVSALAGLHAKFWEGRRDDSPLGVRKFDYEASISRRMHSASWGRVRESTLTVPQGLLDTAEFIQPFIGTIRNRLGAPPTTLLHGDVRADNAFFDADTVKLIDWQAVREGRAAYDLAYFVSTSLTEETGRQHQEGLLDLYVETITSLGVEGYGMSECLEDFRWALLDVVSFVGIIGAALDFSEGRGLQLANLVMSRLWSSLEENRAIDLLDRVSPNS